MGDVLSSCLNEGDHKKEGALDDDVEEGWGGGGIVQVLHFPHYIIHARLVIHSVALCGGFI